MAGAFNIADCQVAEDCCLVGPTLRAGAMPSNYRGDDDKMGKPMKCSRHGQYSDDLSSSFSAADGSHEPSIARPADRMLKASIEMPREMKAALNRAFSASARLRHADAKFSRVPILHLNMSPAPALSGR